MPESGVQSLFVELTLLSTEDGGRTGWISNGYRPDCRWDGLPSGQHHGASVSLTVDLLQPGGSANAVLLPHVPAAWSVSPGTEVEMYEGLRLIGRAVVLRVTDGHLPDLNEIEEALRGLLIEIEPYLGAKDTHLISDLLDAMEYGVALEDITDAATCGRVSLQLDQQKALQDAARRMKTPIPFLNTQ